MFRFFKKKETPEQAADRVYTETQDAFQELQIVRTLAEGHKLLLSGDVTESEAVDLILAVHRTMLVALGFAAQRLEESGVPDDIHRAIQERLFKRSGLSNIRDMIEESSPVIIQDPNERVRPEAIALIRAGRAISVLHKNNRFEDGHNLWRSAATGRLRFAEELATMILSGSTVR